MPGISFFSPWGGKGISKDFSPTLRARVSSFNLSQARSLARMSIDRVLATAPRPRGWSAPLTQTSNGKLPPLLPTWPTKSAKSPVGVLSM